MVSSLPLLLTAKPGYNPPKIQVAYVSQPFDFDFNYTAPLPPSLYTWYKNGKFFEGDGGRVMIDHTGIAFTSVRPGDTGQYSIKAGVLGERVTVYSTLKGEGEGVVC